MPGWSAADKAGVLKLRSLTLAVGPRLAGLVSTGDDQIDLDALSLGDAITLRGPGRAAHQMRLHAKSTTGEVTEWRFVEADPRGDLPIDVAVADTNGHEHHTAVSPCLTVWAWPDPSGSTRFDSRIELACLDGVDPLWLSEWLAKVCGLLDWNQQIAASSNVYAMAMPDELYYEHVRRNFVDRLAAGRRAAYVTGTSADPEDRR